MPHQLDFRLLGPLEVRDDGRSLALGGRKQRSLLAILLLHANEAVSDDLLTDGLWGERPPKTAGTALQVHVSALRKLLSAERLERRAPGYLLHVEPEELDLARFERLCAEARGQEPEAAAATLAEALALWRGRPLADFAYDSFAQGEIARLEELRLGAIEQRIEAELALGRHAELVGELEALVGEHPLRERLREQQILALYRCGRQAEALEAYRQARQTLVEELGIEPSPALKELEKAILAQDVALDAVGEPPGRSELPRGTVTLLFTDIEGSTRLERELRDRYVEVLNHHQRLLRRAFEKYGGREIDTQGDSFFVAFPRASDAVSAAVEAQQALVSHPWPGGQQVRVRSGIHTGEASLSEGRYFGLAVHRAARISAAAHGGQILLSSSTRDVVADDLPPDQRLLDLGVYRLKDLPRPERVFQLVVDGLPSQFPPLRTLEEQELAPPMTLDAGRDPYGRVGTLLMTDIAGFSRFLRVEGDDAAAEVAANYRQIVQETVAAHQGITLDAIADSVLAVFDRPRDAVACAVAARDHLQKHGWPPGFASPTAFVVHTGRLVSKYHGGTSVLHTVELMHEAEPGQILVSHSTEALLEGERLGPWKLRDLGERVVGSSDAPHRVFELVDDGSG